MKSFSYFKWFRCHCWTKNSNCHVIRCPSGQFITLRWFQIWIFLSMHADRSDFIFEVQFCFGVFVCTLYFLIFLFIHSFFSLPMFAQGTEVLYSPAASRSFSSSTPEERISHLSWRFLKNSGPCHQRLQFNNSITLRPRDKKSARFWSVVIWHQELTTVHFLFSVFVWLKFALPQVS